MAGRDLSLAVAPDYPGGREPGSTGLEHQPDPGLGGGRGERVLDASPVTPARHRAVERERDGVQDGRLAGPGRPDQDEEVGVGEVHCGRFPEHRETVQVQPERPHRVPATRSMPVLDWLLIRSSCNWSNSAPRATSPMPLAARYSA